MTRPIQVWLVHLNEDNFENVIVTADGREMAKRMAFGLLFGNMDEYIVTPITELGSRTVFMITAEVAQR